MICLWEISLFFNVDLIKSKYEAMLKKLPRGTIGRVFLFEHVPLKQALSLKFWANIWAVYSLVDESYSDQKSYGFFIDIGNGFSTLAPTILFAVGMTLQDHLMSPKWLGILGLASFWQEFYGTVMYFTSYLVNKRWRKHGSTAFQIFILVILPNVTWMVFPGLGMWASIELILNDSYDIFL